MVVEYAQPSLWKYDDMTDPVPSAAVYIHPKCGLPAVPDVSQPSIDDRYAIGHCNTCTDPKRLTKKARPVEQLIRQDAYDPAVFDERRERDEMLKLARSFADDNGRTMAIKSIARMVEFVDKYGIPDFVITDRARNLALQYQPPKTKAGEKKGRGA